MCFHGCFTRKMTALVAQWIEHGSPKAGVGGSIPLWGTNTLALNWRLTCSGGVSPIRLPPPLIQPDTALNSAVCRGNVVRFPGMPRYINRHGTSVVGPKRVTKDEWARIRGDIEATMTRNCRRFTTVTSFSIPCHVCRSRPARFLRHGRSFTRCVSAPE